MGPACPSPCHPSGLCSIDGSFTIKQRTYVDAYYGCAQWAAESKPAWRLATLSVASAPCRQLKAVSC